MRNKLFLGFGMLGLFLFLAAVAVGILTGTVKSTAGSALPGVTVTIVETSAFIKTTKLEPNRLTTRLNPCRQNILNMANN